MTDRALILETAGKIGQVGLAEGDRLIVEARLEDGRRRASDLAKAVDALLRQVGWAGKEISRVIVGLGPGSYTGLRVGLASAKAFAYATGAAFTGVETFAGIVVRLPEEARLASIVSDALQGKVFCRDYQRDENGWSPMTSLATKSVDEWRQSLRKGTFVAGPAAFDVEGMTLMSLHEPRPADLLDVSNRLAWATTTDLWTAEPLYLRGSSAEEKAASQMASMT